MLGLTTYAEAQNIVYITREDEEYFDPNWNDYCEFPFVLSLEGAGYTVIRMYNSVTSLSTAGQATLDTLNNANLVILGRSEASTITQDPNKEAWNAITVPLLNLSVWTVRNSRLNWFNSTASVNIDDEVSYNATIDIQDDPVFDGIDVSGDVPWCNGPVSFLEEDSAGNGIVLARESVNNWVLFVHFEAGVEFYDGSVDMPAGPRSLIGNGNDNGRTTEGAHIFNFWNWTDQSEQVFLAEVARMVALTSVENKQPTSPTNFSLDQNYPNPFNPETTIEFKLEKAGYTILEVYNINGQLVTTLLEGPMSGGHHQVKFNGKYLPSGIYFYKLTSGNFTEIKKMALLK